MTATILYATDLGHSGARPRQLACLLAKSLGARLFLVHAADAGDEINPLDVPASVRPAAEVMVSRLKQRIDFLSRELENEREQCSKLGIACESYLADGRPWEAIIEEASRRGASLIVVGARSTQNRILGSTADRVVRHSPCPVFVACGDAELPPHLEGARWMIGTDLSPEAQAAVNEVKKILESHTYELMLVHVIKRLDGSHDHDLSKWLHHTKEEGEQRLREWAQTYFPNARFEVRIAHHDPGDELCVAAEEWKASFLALGTHGRSGASRWLLGSTAERCLRKSHVPVLVVRDSHRGKVP